MCPNLRTYSNFAFDCINSANFVTTQRRYDCVQEEAICPACVIVEFLIPTKKHKTHEFKRAYGLRPFRERKKLCHDSMTNSSDHHFHGAEATRRPPLSSDRGLSPCFMKRGGPAFWIDRPSFLLSAHGPSGRRGGTHRGPERPLAGLPPSDGLEPSPGEECPRPIRKAPLPIDALRASERVTSRDRCTVSVLRSADLSVPLAADAEPDDDLRVKTQEDEDVTRSPEQLEGIL